MSYFVGYNQPSWSEAFKICPIFFSWEPVEKVTAFCLLLSCCEQRFVPGMRASHRRSFSDFPIVWRSCFRTHPEPTGGLLLLTNKMAVNGTKPAESLRYLACSLAALNPAPWEKVRLEIFRRRYIRCLHWVQNDQKCVEIILNIHVKDRKLQLTCIFTYVCELEFQLKIFMWLDQRREDRSNGLQHQT